MSDAAAPGPAVFIDKDGTLVENVPFNVDPQLLTFTPRAMHGLRLLQGCGYRLVVVTNQPGVAMGRFDEAALKRLQTALGSRLAAHGIRLSGFHACPHSQGGGCACRKPAPGLLLRAAAELNIDLERSWMVGDILDDVQAGHRAGCRSVLLDVGNETEWQLTPERTPEHRVTDLWQAACRIVKEDFPARRPAPAEAPMPKEFS